MRLYHTGERIIQNPDIRYGRKTADFGQGFYLTPDREFTYRWAGKNAVVNEYELSEAGLRIHRFSRDAAWFQYIFDNRRAQDALDTDVVIGPIANDTIFDTMGVVSSGFLSPDDALRLLRVGPLYTQAAIKSERAVRQLRWLGAERIERADEAQLRAEKDAVLRMFAAELDRL